MSKIQQLQLQFLATEDRLMLTVTTTTHETAYFLLTRRYVLLLHPVLNKILASMYDDSIEGKHSHPPKQSMNHNSTPSDQSETSETQDTTESNTLKPPPETAHKNAILLAKISTHVENKHLTLSLSPETGSGINFVMDESLTLQLLTLLADSTQKSNWQLDLQFNPQSHINPSQTTKLVLH